MPIIGARFEIGAQRPSPTAIEILHLYWPEG